MTDKWPLNGRFTLVIHKNHLIRWEQEHSRRATAMAVTTDRRQRVLVALDGPTFERLQRLATDEERDVAGQVVWLLRQRLNEDDARAPQLAGAH